MMWLLVTQGLTLLLDIILIRCNSQPHKDLELLLLRQQLRILQRKSRSNDRLNRTEKLTLATLLAKFKHMTLQTCQQLNSVVFIVRPETVLRWHRELVRLKWTFKKRVPSPGRPSLPPEHVALIVQLARENPRWGYRRISGELWKLGYRTGKTTIAQILRRHGLTPAPKRIGRSGSWSRLLQHYRQQVLACDFFTVETLTLHTLYVIFFIELHTRQIVQIACTAHPTSVWVTQQARQVVWRLEAKRSQPRAPIHDRDTKFTGVFDAVFQSECLRILQTPYRTPNANAVAERWVQTIRAECLDHLFILNERRLGRVLREYTQFYNERRPHQGLEQGIPKVFQERAIRVLFGIGTCLGG
jgi:putative transposase